MNDNGFLYSFNDVTLDKPIYNDALLEMLRRQITILLEIVVFTNKGYDIKVDGFKLHFDDSKVYPLYEEKDIP